MISPVSRTREKVNPGQAGGAVHGHCRPMQSVINEGTYGEGFLKCFLNQGRLLGERSQPRSFSIPRLIRAFLTLTESILFFRWVYPAANASWQTRFRVHGFPLQAWITSERAIGVKTLDVVPPALLNLCLI